VESNVKNRSTGISAWAPVAMGALCVSPNAQRQGSGLPFAGYPTVITDGLVLGMTAAHTADDAKVPDPRGRKR
jgi:hypothetical protein